MELNGMIERSESMSGAGEAGADLNDLLCCPFCGHKPSLGDPSTLHPNGIYWVESDDVGREYFGRNHSMYAGKPTECWDMNCLEEAGGCGARIVGDDKQDAIARWQRRAT